MNYVVNDVNRVLVSGGFRGFKTTTLVNGNVYQYRAWLHVFDVFTVQ